MVLLSLTHHSFHLNKSYTLLFLRVTKPICFLRKRFMSKIILFHLDLKKLSEYFINFFFCFQDMLLRAVRTSKIQQTGVQPTIKPHKWSYASAFLYSLTLITTIGKYRDLKIYHRQSIINLEIFNIKSTLNRILESI